MRWGQVAVNICHAKTLIGNKVKSMRFLRDWN